MNQSELIPIYAAVVSTTVAAVQITNLVRAIERDRLKIKVTACVKEIDVPGIMPHQEDKKEEVKYEYYYTEDGQLLTRCFSNEVGNPVFERFAYKEEKALVVEILNNSDSPLSLSYIGFRLPNKTTLPTPFDIDLIQKPIIYPRHEWLTYSRHSNTYSSTVRAKGKSIFWIEAQSFYDFLLNQGIQGKIKVNPFIEDENGKPIDGKTVTLFIQV